MLRVEVVSQLSAEPDDFQARWSAIASSSPYATVFQTPQWLVTWWHELGSKVMFRRLHVLAVYDGDDLVGVAPLVRSGWYGLPFSRLSFMGAGASDYCDFISATGREHEVVQSILTHLNSSRDWNLLDIREAREGGIARAFISSLDQGFKYSEWPLEPCPYLDLPIDADPDENWSTLLKSYSKKTRANINYYDRALGKTFAVEHKVNSEPAEIDGAFRSLFDLHTKRWSERWLPGVFGNKSVQSFHISAGKRLNEIGALRLRQVALDGECVAVLYVFAYNGRSSYYQGGFEPALAKHSLGSVLIARALRGAIDDGHTTFDFLRGNEEYKRRWTSGQQKLNTRILVTKSSWTLSLAEQIHRMEQWVETNAKRAFAGGLVRKAPKPRNEPGNED